MPIRTARAEWIGDASQGKGRIELNIPLPDCPFDFRSRMAAGAGGNPEELIAAAQAGCLSMSLVSQIGDAGYRPERVRTTARVHFAQKGGDWMIDRIDLEAEAAAPGLGQDELQRLAERAMERSPVASALAGVYAAIEARPIG